MLMIFERKYPICAVCFGHYKLMSNLIFGASQILYPQATDFCPQVTPFFIHKQECYPQVTPFYPQPTPCYPHATPHSLLFRIQLVEVEILHCLSSKYKCLSCRRNFSMNHVYQQFFKHNSKKLGSTARFVQCRSTNNFCSKGIYVHSNYQISYCALYHIPQKKYARNMAKQCAAQMLSRIITNEIYCDNLVMSASY